MSLWSHDNLISRGSCSWTFLERLARIYVVDVVKQIVIDNSTPRRFIACTRKWFWTHYIAITQESVSCQHLRNKGRLLIGMLTFSNVRYTYWLLNLCRLIGALVVHILLLYNKIVLICKKIVDILNKAVVYVSQFRTFHIFDI